MNYKTITSNHTTEEEIKKSRFICHLKRVTSEEEARDFIAAIKKEHYRANHSCSAMIIGENSEVKRSSDDGEPSGTAGVPMLTVLEKQELTNVVAVVTRYFGGIKLGAGGLIRAYTGSVAQALNEIGLVTVKEQVGLQVILTYPQYQTFANFLEQENLEEFNTQFLEYVTSDIYTDEDRLSDLQSALTEFYQGKISFQKIDSKIVEVPIP
ncbi:YigZ family protein [Streptococcus pluranimalium]|uniref:IMPACT family member YigZ n=1 Tax=Streptococcus pluranimalium TaxID=82348 RepID=A0A345VLT3_9STRE|nr:YigZ family protein [Streptococcus pluranimalium]AXJ13685.1 IMPACT family member YigZ [Streptococcus pluranimalium]